MAADDNHDGDGKETRVVCVQVRRRPIRDSLDAVLEDLLTGYLKRSKCNTRLPCMRNSPKFRDFWFFRTTSKSDIPPIYCATSRFKLNETCIKMIALFPYL